MHHACNIVKDAVNILSYGGVEAWMINYFNDNGNAFDKDNDIEREAYFLGRHITVSLHIKVVCFR
jgi:hypothetical protein